MSTAQVESALVEHKSVAEAAVVAAPHAVKGECKSRVKKRRSKKTLDGLLFFTL